MIITTNRQCGNPLIQQYQTELHGFGYEGLVNLVIEVAELIEYRNLADRELIIELLIVKVPQIVFVAIPFNMIRERHLVLGGLVRLVVVDTVHLYHSPVEHVAVDLRHVELGIEIIVIVLIRIFPRALPQMHVDILEHGYRSSSVIFLGDIRA